MARRTKAEAQATRDHLLDTAERVFLARGVSRTSLAEIAAAAGVTRGAIYWHFRDKVDLFNAMMERVVLPMEEPIGRGIDAGALDPLVALRRRFVEALRKIANDPQVRRVFEIATHKVEYVDALSGVRERHLSVRSDCLAQVHKDVSLAMRRGFIGRRLPARSIAIGLHALIDGLIQNWMLDPGAFDLVKVGKQVLDAYFAGLLPSPLPGATGDAA